MKPSQRVDSGAPTAVYMRETREVIRLNMRGKVVQFDERTGRGEIQPNDGTETVEVRVESVTTWPQRLREGDVVTYEVDTNDVDHAVATDVARVAERGEARVEQPIIKEALHHSFTMVSDPVTGERRFLFFGNLRFQEDAVRIREGAWIEYTPKAGMGSTGQPRDDAVDAFIIDGRSAPREEAAVEPVLAPEHPPVAVTDGNVPRSSSVPGILLVDYSHYERGRKDPGYADLDFRAVIRSLPYRVDEVVVFTRPGFGHDIVLVKTPLEQMRQDAPALAVVESHSPSHDALLALLERTHSYPAANYFLFVDAPPVDAKGVLASLQPESRVYRVCFSHSRPAVPEAEQIIIRRKVLTPEERVAVLDFIERLYRTKLHTEPLLREDVRGQLKDELHEHGLGAVLPSAVDEYLDELTRLGVWTGGRANARLERAAFAELLRRARLGAPDRR